MCFRKTSGPSLTRAALATRVVLLDSSLRSRVFFCYHTAVSTRHICCMIPHSALRRGCRAALCLALLTPIACADLPTGPEAFQLQADGEFWTAIVPPPGLPSIDSWLQQLPEESPVTTEIAEQVAALRAEASEARTRGDLQRADELLLEATQRALAAMDGAPGQRTLLTGIASLASWDRSLRMEIDLSRTPALAATVEAVAEDRAAADAALKGGDPHLAAVHLTRGAERIRHWAPTGVALQVLSRVDTHLANTALAPGGGGRTAHLVESARYELLNGNPYRAVQRALYALQLASGQELYEIPEDETSRCGEYTC